MSTDQDWSVGDQVQLAFQCETLVGVGQVIEFEATVVRRTPLNDTLNFYYLSPIAQPEAARAMFYEAISPFLSKNGDIYPTLRNFGELFGTLEVGARSLELGTVSCQEISFHDSLPLCPGERLTGFLKLGGFSLPCELEVMQAMPHDTSGSLYRCKFIWLPKGGEEALCDAVLEHTPRLSRLYSL